MLNLCWNKLSDIYSKASLCKKHASYTVSCNLKYGVNFLSPNI